MTHWYTADLHFGHENIIPFSGRPFRDAGHMDSVLIEKMWSKVAPDDDLWIVGDFACGPKSQDAEYLKGVFSHLPGARQHLIVGNHDGPPTQQLPWATVSPMAEIEDGGKTHVLCHYPMITWATARRGGFNIFGHVHNNWLGSRNAVNVGVDVWDFLPVQLDDIIKRAKTLPENKHWRDVEHNV